LFYRTVQKKIDVLYLYNTLMKPYNSIISKYLIISVALGLFLAAMPVLALQKAPTFTVSEVPNTPQAPISSLAPDLSYNWAGYAATNGKFTAVRGTWIVPSVSMNTDSTTADAIWVGIGGVVSSDLIQTGTQAITMPSGNIVYQAWYEKLPSSSQIIPMDIKPGDSITALVSQVQTGVWNISLTDNTTNQNFNINTSYNSSLSSAEWMVEAPSTLFGLLPLDQFQPFDFSNSQTTMNDATISLQQSGAKSISMVNTFGQTLASPSQVGSDGGSFSLIRTANQPSIISQQPGFTFFRQRRHRSFSFSFGF